MKLIITLFFAIGLTACIPSSNTMDIKDAYMFATPKTFPAAAIFMTIDNNTDADDRMIGFRTQRAGRTELHTMETVNDIMRMRQVEAYNVPSDGKHVLKPMADHVMVFDMVSDFTEGEIFDAIAIFEMSGEVPFTVTVKPRADMMKHH